MTGERLFAYDGDEGPSVGNSQNAVVREGLAVPRPDDSSGANTTPLGAAHFNLKSEIQKLQNDVNVLYSRLDAMYRRIHGVSQSFSQSLSQQASQIGEKQTKLRAEVKTEIGFVRNQVERKLVVFGDELSRCRDKLVNDHLDVQHNMDGIKSRLSKIQQRASEPRSHMVKPSEAIPIRQQPQDENRFGERTHDREQKFLQTQVVAWESELADLRNEVLALKSQQSNIETGSIAFSSLLNAWLNDNKTGGAHFEEEELAEAGARLPVQLLLKVVVAGILKLSKDQTQTSSEFRTELQRLRGDSSRSASQDGHRQPAADAIYQSLIHFEQRLNCHICLDLADKARFHNKLEACADILLRLSKQLSRSDESGTTGIFSSLKEDAADVAEWTKRYISVIASAPGDLNTEATLQAYKDSITKLHRDILQGEKWTTADKNRHLVNVNALLRCQQLATESIAAAQTISRRSKDLDADRIAAKRPLSAETGTSVEGTEGDPVGARIKRHCTDKSG